MVWVGRVSDGSRVGPYIVRWLSDPTPEVWGRPRGTSAGLYRGLPYKPRHAYETNPRHRGGNRGSERRVREAEEDTREAEEDKE